MSRPNITCLSPDENYPSEIELDFAALEDILDAPTATVSPTIADAFGMSEIPGVEIVDRAICAACGEAWPCEYSRDGNLPALYGYMEHRPTTPEPEVELERICPDWCHYDHS